MDRGRGFQGIGHQPRLRLIQRTVCGAHGGPPGAALRRRLHHVHDRHDRKAERCRMDAGEFAVGVQVRRAGLRAQERGCQPDLVAAVPCGRTLLVVSAGALGRRHRGRATEIFGEPFLACVAGASRHPCLAGSVHLDGLAAAGRARAAFLSPVDRRPWRQRIAGLQPHCLIRAVLGHDRDDRADHLRRSAGPGRGRRAGKAFARARDPHPAS
jgi:hypothetical protein